MVSKFIISFSLILTILSATGIRASIGAPAKASAPAGFLTLEERLWLDAHPIIRLAPDPDFAPIEFLDKEGRFRGIAADTLALVEKMLGIRFTIIRLKSWDEVLRRAQSREIDMFGAATNTPDRKKYMSFTKPHIVLPGVIIVRSDVEGSFTMEKIRRKKVAVVSGYMWQELIERDYPEFEFHLVPDVATGLKQVSFGTVDVFVGNLATVTHYISEEGIVNLRVGGQTGYFAGLATGVRKDWPIMISIIEKALARISQAQKDEILRKWIGLKRPTWVFGRSFLVALVFFLAVAAFVSTDKYVHERIKANKSLARSRELVMRAEKLSSIGTLTAGAAHEILNPANIIGLHAQKFMRQFDEGSSEYKAAGIIHRNVDRITRICDDLRRFSRDERGSISEFNPNQTVRDSLDLLLHELRLGSVRYELDISEEDSVIMGDPHQIQQVIFNLISNAKDAMPLGGILIVTSSEVIEGGKRWWECRVKDTGIGIPEDILPKLFDPFFTTKSVDKGTGLGLSVTFGIIETHGGKIWAESEEGKGATFIVHLPIGDSA